MTHTRFLLATLLESPIPSKISHIVFSFSIAAGASVECGARTTRRHITI